MTRAVSEEAETNCSAKVTQAGPSNWRELEYLTISETARVLRVVPLSIHRYREAGFLDMLKPGGKWLVTVESVKRFLSEAESSSALSA